MRRKRLYRVVALSRFLIRPSVRCHLLASKALGRVLRLLPFDFSPVLRLTVGPGGILFLELLALGAGKKRIKRDGSVRTPYCFD